MQLEPNTSTAQSLHPVISRLFTKKGYTQKDVEDFLSWDLKALPKLTELKDIEKTSERLIKAMDNNEKIGIYGDYDVDGTTSCAVFYHFFKSLGHEVELFQPSRFVEGYGIHPSSIDQAQAKNVDVLVTVDCGITNNEAAEYALERGLDLIITDHHTDARDEMPRAFAIVNPNRRDEPSDSPLRPLAGVGVAFAVCWQMRMDLMAKGRECPSLYPLLQFVAVGTICDLAKLTNMNLKLVRHGLKQMTSSQYKGLTAFTSPEERRQDMIPSEKLSFQIGPMINSKGRLEHPEKALLLLITDDEREAFEYHAHLEICNNERKFIQGQVFNGAKDQVMDMIEDADPLINIVYSEEWHEGVIGIVASKLVECFKVPAVVFTNSEQEGIIKASARSAGALNLFECLDNCNDLFIKFGGHKAAAGLSMPVENLPEFRRRMNEQLREIPSIQRTVQEHYDIEIKAHEVTPTLVRELSLLEPFGMGNEKPVFKMSGLQLESFKILKDVHVRWNFTSLDDPKIKLQGISFNYLNKWGMLHPADIFESQHKDGGVTAVFTLGINRFNGNEYIQLMVERLSTGLLS